MAKSSKSLANQRAQYELAVAGAKKHAAQLPKEIQVVVKGLEAENAELNTLNTKQEALTADLVALTKQLRDKAKSATAKRTKIVRQAEATFGVGAVELRDFRSATDGKL